ncbi:hypothetical protein [Photobacterium galatheae]|uniref:Uncharacterized protein n=1 Tax=Photobacterium galatheae TaxID=1654360 RepID=A0A066RTA9_9GAMM|nr:hypothetical protein [Photobacterium galatheae]KDM90942.1 hypothetical protein EA58_14395 [Photobacterium galatheae]MCM0149094.1 hypothetical protein [Photobacterium galatheae]
MKNLFKTGAFLMAIPLSAVAFAQDFDTFFEQPLGGSLNGDLVHKDVSQEVPSGDGTLTYLYKPSKESAIPFKNYASYLTPISKKVAIIEASKVEDNLESCTASLRYFTREYADKSLSKFKTFSQLNELGYKIPPNQNPHIVIRYNPEQKHYLQYGCTPSDIEKGKFAFIVSFSDGNLKSIAEKERDKILATKN